MGKTRGSRGRSRGGVWHWLRRWISFCGQWRRRFFRRFGVSSGSNNAMWPIRTPIASRGGGFLFHIKILNMSLKGKSSFQSNPGHLWRSKSSHKEDEDEVIAINHSRPLVVLLGGPFYAMDKCFSVHEPKLNRLLIDDGLKSTVERMGYTKH